MACPPTSVLCVKCDIAHTARALRRCVPANSLEVPDTQKMLLVCRVRRQEEEQRRAEELEQQRREEEELRLAEEAQRLEHERYLRAVEEQERKRQEDEQRLEMERREVSNRVAAAAAAIRPHRSTT